jgi:regulatory protein
MNDPLKIALNFLKFRPRSVFEIREKLKSKRISDAEIKKTIALLKKAELLDDEKFAKMYVRDKNLLKPTGIYLLRLELKKLGVSDTDIEKATKDQDEEELASRALESKSRYRDADFNHQAQFLARRGFATNVIWKILKKNNTE